MHALMGGMKNRPIVSWTPDAVGSFGSLYVTTFAAIMGFGGDFST